MMLDNLTDAQNLCIAQFIILMILQYMDIDYTNKVLKAGGTELNVIMVWCQKQFGSFWWIPKVALVSLAGIVMFYFQSYIGMACLVVLYLAIVINNIYESKKS